MNLYNKVLSQTRTSWRSSSKRIVVANSFHLNVLKMCNAVRLLCCCSVHVQHISQTAQYNAYSRKMFEKSDPYRAAPTFRIRIF